MPLLVCWKCHDQDKPADRILLEFLYIIVQSIAKNYEQHRFKF